jgi:hypothetical protein
MNEELEEEYKQACSKHYEALQNYLEISQKYDSLRFELARAKQDMDKALATKERLAKELLLSPKQKISELSMVTDALKTGNANGLNDSVNPTSFYQGEEISRSSLSTDADPGTIASKRDSRTSSLDAELFLSLLDHNPYASLEKIGKKFRKEKERKLRQGVTEDNSLAPSTTLPQKRTTDKAMYLLSMIEQSSNRQLVGAEDKEELSEEVMKSELYLKMFSASTRDLEDVANDDSSQEIVVSKEENDSTVQTTLLSTTTSDKLPNYLEISQKYDSLRFELARAKQDMDKALATKERLAKELLAEQHNTQVQYVFV